MLERSADVERFALLLATDAKLAEAGKLLRNAEVTRGVSQIAALRSTVASALQKLQNAVYGELAAKRH